MNVLRSILFVFCCCAHQLWAFTYLPATQNLMEGSSQVEWTNHYTQTLSLFDNDAKKRVLPENEKFHSIDSLLLLSYGFTEQLQLTFGTRFRQNSAQFQTDIANENITTSGIESHHLRFRYSFKREEGTQYAIEGQYSLTPYANEIVRTRNDVTALDLGDDGQGVAVGLSFSHQSKNNNFLSGRVHFRNPSPSLSSEILTQLEGALVGRFLALHGGVEAVRSLSQDPYFNDPENKPSIRMAVTNRFNSINREWVAPYLGLTIGIGKNWSLGYQAKYFAMGRSFDEAIEHGLTLIRRSDPPDIYAQKNSAFKEYTMEGYVKKIQAEKKLCTIDIGLSQGLQQGMRVDFYYFDYLGVNELIGSGVIVKVKASESIVRIDAIYTKRAIEEGTVARAGLVK